LSHSYGKLFSFIAKLIHLSITDKELNISYTFLYVSSSHGVERKTKITVAYIHIQATEIISFTITNILQNKINY
jgi:hypothetical protein